MFYHMDVFKLPQKYLGRAKGKNCNSLMAISHLYCFFLASSPKISYAFEKITTLFFRHHFKDKVVKKDSLMKSEINICW